MMHHVILIGLSVMTASAAPGQTAPQPSTTNPPSLQSQPTSVQPKQQVPPEMILGQRAWLPLYSPNASFPLADRVVLVPDAATYIAELEKWSPSGIWPVLIEDDYFAPMFIRSFKPAHVLRRDPIGAIPVGQAALRKKLESIVIRTWGGNPDEHTVREAFEQLPSPHFPPGVVIASTDDSGWTAAVALAAAHGQPLLWHDGELNRSSQQLDMAQSSMLIENIEALIRDTGYEFSALGDVIDAITMCRSMAGRATFKPVAAGQPETVATTHLIGLSRSGKRYAYAGWIFGDEIRCAYVAMCSLFLNRERVWMFDTYAGTAQLSHYTMDQARSILSSIEGFQVNHAEQTSAQRRSWMLHARGGLETDVVMVNTKGMPDKFAMTDGTDAHAHDVPILNEPAIVHFTHSFSFARPEDMGTIAAQWIAHGAYAYFGSTAEPYLESFVQPHVLVGRCMGGGPFLVSARNVKRGPARPELHNAYGDPLMLWLPPKIASKDRTDAIPLGDGVDVMELAKLQIRDIKTLEDEELAQAYGRAAHSLTMLGRDRLVLQLWKKAKGENRASYIARWALGALFRARDTEGFVQAFRMAGIRDAWALDMLWHVTNPEFNQLVSEDALIQLRGAIRSPSVYVDVQRLVEPLTAGFGVETADAFVSQVYNTTSSERERNEIRKLMRREPVGQ